MTAEPQNPRQDDSFEFDNRIDTHSLEKQLEHKRRNRRLGRDPEDFARRAFGAIKSAEYADGEQVLALVLESLTDPDPPSGTPSREARVATALAKLRNVKGRPGRRRRRRVEIMFRIAQEVSGGSALPLLDVSLNAVEEVTGRRDEGLAKTMADDFSADRGSYLRAYLEDEVPHRERRIARLIVDLFFACGLEVDPTVTAPLNRRMTSDELEDEWEAWYEAMARRD